MVLQMGIEIGKYTLESLTTGMYSEPESCYREYIQNAVDSIDVACAARTISADESRIEIIIDGDRQEICIRDNGSGICKGIARKTLLDIGNSTKLHTSNRGFRGIGRLGGLSYCKRLSFCTTAVGENEKTIVTFNCEKLKQMLVPGQSVEHNLQSVMDEVTEVKFLQELSSAHYFVVKMEGVDDISSLLELEIVKDYIAQIAPVPFRDKFIWSREIRSSLAESKVAFTEYPIYVGETTETLSQVYKPYKNNFDSNSRTQVSKDSIHGLSFFQINDRNKRLLASGWYADTEFSGTLVDERISGIRVRQGNIQIGNQRTLAMCFKESRFNGWAVGEVYVASPDLIPNARRDDFENNNAYTDFIIGLRDTVCVAISDKIRAVSKIRNNPIQKTLLKIENDISKTTAILASGFHSSADKAQIANDLSDARKELLAIPRNSSSEVVERKAALLERLAKVTEEVCESSNYRVKKDMPSNFSKVEKNIVQAMMEVLSRNFERTTVDSLYNEFVKELNSRISK